MENHKFSVYRINIKTPKREKNKMKYIREILYKNKERSNINFFEESLEFLKNNISNFEISKRCCRVNSIEMEETLISSKNAIILYGFMDTGYYGETSTIVSKDGNNSTIKNFDDTEFVKFYYSICFIDGLDYIILGIHHKIHLNMTDPFKKFISDQIKDKFSLRNEEEEIIYPAKINFERLMPYSWYEAILKSPVEKISFIKRGIPKDEADELETNKKKESDSNIDDTMKDITRTLSYSIKEEKNTLENIKDIFTPNQRFTYVSVFEDTPDDIKTEIALNNKKKVIKLSNINNTSRFSMDLSDEDLEFDNDGTVNLESIKNWNKIYLEMFKFQ